MGKREIMLRAVLVLVGVGSLVTMELRTPPRVVGAVNQPLVTSAVGVRDSQDTLAAVDRLEIPYLRGELSTQPISSAERLPANAAALVSSHPGKSTASIRHDSKASKVASVAPRPRPKLADSKPKS